MAYSSDWASMDFEKSWNAWFGKGTTFNAVDTSDPLKTAVSSPLSKFLSERIGQGIPSYTGQIYEPVDAATESRYAEFVGTDPSTFFQENIVDPTMKEWNKYTAPLIEEGYAGGLRGSGRFRGLEESAKDVSTKLTETAAQYIPNMYTSQLAAGTTMSQLKTEQKQLEYKKWLSELPEYSPILDKALSFLGVDSGYELTTYLDDDEGMWGDLMGGIEDVMAIFGF